MNQKQPLKLFHSRTFCKPNPGHPRYLEFEFGRLNVWILAENINQARSFASSILAVLPYQQAKNHGVIAEVEQSLNPGMDFTYKIAVTNAQLAGVCVTLEPGPTDSEVPSNLEFA